jgi:DNA-binding IclR family transcriptional regulator
MRSRAKTDLSLYRGKASAPKGKYAAPALDKAFDIIELLADRPRGALVSEMAAELNRSIGELFRIVIVMEKRGFLEKSQDDDRYTVAYKILDLAYRATPAQDLTRAAAPQMEALARAVEQSCHLVVPNGGSGLVVARQENPGVRGFALRLGAPIDLIRSCSGHVLLAFSRPDRTDRMLELAQRSRDAQVDRAKIEKTLAKVRERGFDMMASPITHGVTDISYPVFGFHGDVMAALTIPFLELIDGSQKVGMEETRRQLQGTAQRISSLLGHHGRT